MSVRVLQAMLFVWLLFLNAMQLWAVQVDERRLRMLSEIKEVNLGDIIDRPEIELRPIYGTEEELSSVLKAEEDLKVIRDIRKMESASQIYLKLVEFQKKRSGSPLREWVEFLKADYLLQAQLLNDQRALNLPLEEYELTIRSYPQSEFVSRALYQVALIKLELHLYQEVEETAVRALEESPNNRYASEFYLLKGEQAFRNQQFVKALAEFSYVVKKYARSRAATDAAFRRAYILFREAKYSDALDTYRNLERYHSDVLNFLKMLTEAGSTEKFLDRIYYAETLYLTGNHAEASQVFQNLANLFPEHRWTPLLWIRFADTFFARDKAEAAIHLYDFIRTKPGIDPLAQALANLRLADSFFLTGSPIDLAMNPSLYDGAYKLAKLSKNEHLTALAIIKKAIYYFDLPSFPRAKSALEHFKEEFSEAPNHELAAKYFVRVLELEILDYYEAGDYLAALTTYLVHEKDVSLEFKDIRVLLKLSEAARGLSLLEKAVEILNRVIYIESNSDARQEALLKLVEILIEEGELKKASERLRRFSFAYPKTTQRYLYEKLWGDLYFQLKNQRRSIDHYESALELAELKLQNLMSIRHVLIRLGELYAETKLPLKAIDYYEKFIALYKDEGEIKLKELPFTEKDRYLTKVARYRVADTLFEMKDYVRALQAYQRVSESIDEEPFYSHALYRLGECYLSLNDRPSAIEAFKLVKSDDVNSPWMRAAQSYIQSVEMEVKNGIRIFN
ncbi:MAG: hypothetical protein COV44_07735 [Deltaproteobacteria bacterium CG11_big_fil_rev_8_21_14_0_20_45_16]|nr:MAG: hypothetical protein COV44_07735 [Deltaproteobacteria bacterium CG11_big_fil_rev_8_21_14_0_20_45_16]